MWRIFSISKKSSTGWPTSRRSGGFISSMPSRFGFGPMNETSEVTSSSRIGSIAGLVTCAKSCLK
ncbi:hypothetical protein D3C83_121320 [compost metagenome]